MANTYTISDLAKEFDLKSPFETNQPVSVRYANGANPVTAAAAE